MVNQRRETVGFRKGDRVSWKDKGGERLHGTVTKGGASIQVAQDGGKYAVKGPASLFGVSDVPAPRDEPSPMDRWGLKAYKEAGGDETPRYEATVTFDGRPALRASNTGIGGPDQFDRLYTSTPDVLEQFLRDVRAWAESFGAKPPVFEPEASWVEWKHYHQPAGVTARAYWEEQEKRRPAPDIAGGEAIRGDMPIPPAPAALPARFTAAVTDKGNGAVVTDTETGRVAEVGLYAYREVVRVLSAFFG